MPLRNDIINKCENKYRIALEKFNESKKDIDNVRQFRNAMQRILNIMNKEQIKSNVYYLAEMHFKQADRKVKETF
jgi:hypothetical protein